MTRRLPVDPMGAESTQGQPARRDDTSPPYPEGHPEQIGPYRLLEMLGAGGMGVVYLAQQSRPVRRRVALKLIKLGMDTKDVVARFESERQAMALLSHPCIAQVFEAGATELGRPYFVMEHVPGIPINEYCDGHRLTIPQRLELFVQVCEGIQHAHQTGIIHRDIKPTNILVTVLSGKPLPKIIDFGVAKATNQRLTEKTLFTEQGRLIGTPEFMSPEQAEVTPLDVNSRSDVYSLGVVLYDLLVGSLPFEANELRAGSLEEFRRKIREDEPQRPSTRAGALGEKARQVTHRRREDPTSLSRRLKGDLDWIAMKALEKDQTRRYASAAELAADIDRHLHDQPVLAGPPSASYRLMRFVRKQRGPLAAALADQRDEAVRRSEEALAAQAEAEADRAAAERARRVEEEGRAEAEAARERADRISLFLQSILSKVEPGANGEEPKVSDLLDHAAKEIEIGLARDPVVEATLRSAIGRAYERLGHLEKAEPQLLSAVEIRQRELGEDHPATLSSLHALAGILKSRGRLQESETHLRRALEGRRRVLGDEDPNTLTTLNNLAVSMQAQGKLAGAEPLVRLALRICGRILGDEHPRTIRSKSNLALLLVDQGKADEALGLFRQTLEARSRILGEDHPDTLTSMSNLASLLSDGGETAEAEQLYRKALEGQRLIGTEYVKILRLAIRLGLLLKDQKRLAESERFFREALDICLRVVGLDHPDAITSMRNLARVLRARGKLAEAEPLLRQSLVSLTRLRGAEHPDALRAMHSLAVLLGDQGKFDEAAPHLRRALKLRMRLLGQEHQDTLLSMNALGVLLTNLGELDEAEPLLRTALDGLRKIRGDEHPDTLVSMRNLALLLKAEGRPVEAEPLLQEAVAVLRSVQGPGHTSTLHSMRGLARVLEAQGKVPEAEAVWRDLVETASAALPLGNTYRALFQRDFAAFLVVREKYGEAERHLLEAFKGLGEALGGKDPRTQRVRRRLAALYDAWGRAGEGAAYRDP